METMNNAKIIGIDHGCENMKTANFCFKSGLIVYDCEPLFTTDMLVLGDRYYLIKEGHQEFAPDKIKNEDYYILKTAEKKNPFERQSLYSGAEYTIQLSPQITGTLHL